MAIRPHEDPTHEREIHQTQIKDKLREILHGKVQPTLIGSFIGKTHDIEIPTKALRNSYQLCKPTSLSQRRHLALSTLGP